MSFRRNRAPSPHGPLSSRSVIFATWVGLLLAAFAALVIPWFAHGVGSSMPPWRLATSVIAGRLPVVPPMSGIAVLYPGAVLCAHLFGASAHRLWMHRIGATLAGLGLGVVLLAAFLVPGVTPGWGLLCLALVALLSALITVRAGRTHPRINA